MEKDENTISYHHKNVIEREWNSVRVLISSKMEKLLGMRDFS